MFCSESSAKDPADLSAAVAAAGIVRTKDLNTWERLPNLVTKQSPQQRNVCLLPKFVDGKYAFYTRPMDGFIETGSGGGIGFGLAEDITHAVIEEERMTSLRKYHTITESKNGAGAVPIETEQGWLHLAHGVRNTAAGLRYVLYVFVTDLHEPWKVIAEPSGYFLGSAGRRTGGRCFQRGVPTVRSFVRTARYTFIMHHQTHGCTLPLPTSSDCWITPFTPRRTRFAVPIVSSSGVI